MESRQVSYRRAVEEDITAILGLQQLNLLEVGGMLSASLSFSTISQMIRETPAVVAVSGDFLAGYLLTSALEMNEELPIIQAMLQAYPIDSDTVIYGPICVSSNMRGKGIAQSLLHELERFQPKLKCVCFIRGDNAASIKAHTKLGMQEVALFKYNNVDHLIFLYES